MLAEGVQKYRLTVPRSLAAVLQPRSKTVLTILPLCGIYVYILSMEPTVSVARSRTFRSGNSEAIRLPKDVAYGEDVELVLVRSGDVMTIYPAATTIPEMIAQLNALPAVREIEQRDIDAIPERQGM